MASRRRYSRSSVNLARKRRGGRKRFLNDTKNSFTRPMRSNRKSTWGEKYDPHSRNVKAGVGRNLATHSDDIQRRTYNSDGSMNVVNERRDINKNRSRRKPIRTKASVAQRNRSISRPRGRKLENMDGGNMMYRKRARKRRRVRRTPRRGRDNK